MVKTSRLSLLFALLLVFSTVALGLNEWNQERQEEPEEQQPGQQQEQNPYVFEEQHYTTRIQTQHGRVRVLPRFTERSELLKGIENYRFSTLEAEPNTFILPNHYDAEAVLFVVNGRGKISLVHEDRRESFNIERGDVVRVPTGTTNYLVNSDRRNRLIIAKLLQPVSIPGLYEAFFGAGGENPKSFFPVFSPEILQAAFNTRRDRIQRIFGQQRQGAIVEASEEQIRALSRGEETHIWPFQGESKSKFNIYGKRPMYSNQYGRLYEVDSDDLKRLQDLDVAVSLLNISKGAMSTPEYSSRATRIAYVFNGDGYSEMACPHLTSQEQRPGGGAGGGSQQQIRGGPTYQKVRARLRRGTVVIIPPGHPFVAVASNNQNLEIVSFIINADRNEWFPLAGRRNIFNQLEREAKELAFGVSEREVDEVFNNQPEQHFCRGPRHQPQQEQEGGADA